MKRVRLSTTVDGERLQRCRQLLGVSDSQLVDRAIAVLIDRLVAEREVAALEAQPYESDPDLAWTSDPGPNLPYDGQIPDEVTALAARGRRG